MVEPQFRLFSKNLLERTTYGYILKDRKRYTIERDSRHYYKDFKGLSIPICEFEALEKHYVNNIVFKFIGAKKNTIYRLDIKYLDMFKEQDNYYTFEQEERVLIIPLEYMKIIGIEDKSPRVKQEKIEV